MGKLAYIFPGQGAQHPGMGKDLHYRMLLTRFAYEQADQIRPGTVQQCFEGTEEELRETINAQPCLYATEIATWYATHPYKIVPDMVAGFSLGEIPALAVAGMISTETGMRIVMERARLMQEAVEDSRTGMMAVLKLSAEQVENLCKKFQHIYPVNFNAPDQTVVAGDNFQLDRFKNAVKQEGGRAMPLKVSGAFHTPLLREAARKFGEYLRTVEIKDPDPDVPIYSNYTSRPYPLFDGDYVSLLQNQMCNPVLWQDTIENMIKAGADKFLELGPGKSLAGLIKRIDPSVKVYSVNDWESLEEAMEGVKDHVAKQPLA